MVREAGTGFNGDRQVDVFLAEKAGVDSASKLDWFSELAPVEEIQDGE